MAKRYPLCKCGHRKYKHQIYPIQTPHCKAIPWKWYGTEDSQIAPGCGCNDYIPIDNLEMLEELYVKSLDKNV